MRKLWGTVAVLAISMPAAAWAQASEPPNDRAIDVQLMDYAIGPKSFFTVANADIADPKQLALDAFVTFLTTPFTVYTTDGMDDPTITGERVRVVENLTAAQLSAAYGLNDKVQLGATLPLVFALNGQELSASTGMATGDMRVTGTGDLLVEGKMKLWQATNNELRIAGIAGVSLPTSIGSNESQFIGDNLPTLRGKLAATFSRGRIAIGANTGFILRKPRKIYASEIGQQLTFGVGGAVALTDKFSVISEVFGRGGLQSGFALDESPIEAVGGFRLVTAKSVAVTVGAGTGLDEAIGAPRARFFASVGYAPDVRDSDGDGVQNAKDRCPLIPEDADGHDDRDGCPDDDNDGDRRLDGEDKCVAEAEDLDGLDDDDGCPELDNDGDTIEDLADKCPNDAEDNKEPYPKDGCPGNRRDSDGDNIPDSVDSCPMEEEDVDAFEDGDGCAEADNDADGVADAADRCPLCPEDKDNFEDTDGCPEADNDKDGVVDAKDACPAQAETINGVKDDDGCPDTGGVELVKLDGDRLVIAQVAKMMDRKGKALTKEGDKLVGQIAALMIAHNEVTKWLIALAQPKQPDAQRLAELIKERLAKAGITHAQVLGAAGPAKIGGVVQERADEPPAPMCPAGKEVQQRPDMITPKATMQQRATVAPPATPPATQPEKPDPPKQGDEIEIEMGN
ncbi:MAG TPA: transporter [Kofleriaceae bacterium]